MGRQSRHDVQRRGDEEGRQHHRLATETIGEARGRDDRQSQGGGAARDRERTRGRIDPEGAGEGRKQRLRAVEQRKGREPGEEQGEARPQESGAPHPVVDRHLGSGEPGGSGGQGGGIGKRPGVETLGLARVDRGMVRGATQHGPLRFWIDRPISGEQVARSTGGQLKTTRESSVHHSTPSVDPGLSPLVMTALLDAQSWQALEAFAAALFPGELEQGPGARHALPRPARRAASGDLGPRREPMQDHEGHAVRDDEDPVSRPRRRL